MNIKQFMEQLKSWDFQNFCLKRFAFFQAWWDWPWAIHCANPGGYTNMKVEFFLKVYLIR